MAEVFFCSRKMFLMVPVYIQLECLALDHAGLCGIRGIISIKSCVQSKSSWGEDYFIWPMIIYFSFSRARECFLQAQLVRPYSRLYFLCNFCMGLPGVFDFFPAPD